MANQQGNGRGGSPPDEERSSWRAQDSDRYRMRDDDERFERGYGSHWEDRERNQGSWAQQQRSRHRRSVGRTRRLAVGQRAVRPARLRTRWLVATTGLRIQRQRSSELRARGRRRPQHRYAPQGYGETGQGAYRQHPAGGAQGLEHAARFAPRQGPAGLPALRRARPRARVRGADRRRRRRRDADRGQREERRGHPDRVGRGSRDEAARRGLRRARRRACATSTTSCGSRARSGKAQRLHPALLVGWWGVARHGE